MPSEQTTLVAGTLYFQFEPFEIAFHCAFVPLKVMLVNLVQEKNVQSPMLVTLSGIAILVKPEQEAKALLPMLATLSGITMLVNPEQEAKASFPMLFTLSGIVTLVKPEQ